MQVRIGEKIRELRRRDSRTQEELANSLGVTSQAVSRWESGGSYPDLEIIPKIANYFHISIDTLFGYDNDRQIRVDDILSQVLEMKKTQQASDKIVAVLRNACAEFPSDDKLSFELADALMKQGWACRGARGFTNGDDEYTHNDGVWNSDNEYWQESIRIFSRLISSSSDENIVTYSKQNLVYLYRNIGKYTEAVDIANTFPEMCICKENLLYKATEGKDHCKYSQEALIASVSSVNSALFDALYSRVSSDTEKNKAHSLMKIQKFKGLIGLYELVFDDGNLGFEHITLKDIYLYIVNEYSNLIDTDDDTDSDYWNCIFECLDKALYHSRCFDKLLRSGNHNYTAYLVDHISTDTNEWTASPATPTLSESWHFINKSKLEKNPRWDEWVAKTKEPIL